MKIDIHNEAAKYYDSSLDFLNDISFYQELVLSPDTSILELGYGPGLEGPVPTIESRKLYV